MKKGPADAGPNPKSDAQARCLHHPRHVGHTAAAAAAASFSGTSATIASVVRMFLAIDAAFCSAERVTIAGSMMPSAIRSTISPVAALRPWPFLALRTSLTTTEPSRPAFSEI